MLNNNSPAAVVKKGDFQRCFETTQFCAWAYKSDQHLHSEMEHPKYFGMIRARLVAGDHIYATDAAMNYKTYMIDHVDQEAQEVRLSVLTVHTAVPVMAEDEGEHTWRWRGPRGGGHCIVDAKGEVVTADFPSREQAEAEINRRKIIAETKAELGSQPAAA